MNLESKCNITCSKYCDSKKHLEHGFSISKFNNFSNTFFKKNDDSIRKYIKYFETFF